MIILVSQATRLFKPGFLKTDRKNLSATDANVAELDAISRTILAANQQFSNSCLPTDSIDYGYKFEEFLSQRTNLTVKNVAQDKKWCRSFLIHLCAELMTRMPNNFTAVQKLKYFSPQKCFGKKIQFDELLLELLSSSVHVENIRNLWVRLQSMAIEDVFPQEDVDNISGMDIIDFSGWKFVIIIFEVFLGLMLNWEAFRSILRPLKT